MTTNPNTRTAGAVDVMVENLTKSYDGLAVLRGLNLRVAPGEICVVMGPSGCGKSVLLRHIIGLETPNRGRVLIGGRDVADEEARRAMNLAMVFQSSALLNSLTVTENVGLWLREHRREMTEEEIERIVREKLALLDLAGTEEKLPGDLSGGMRKRVAIARALVMNPSLILYDEPTADLDPVRAADIAQIIRGLKGKVTATAIVVTHDRELAFGIADHMAMLHDGVILEEGMPAQVRASANAIVQEFLRAGRHNASHQPVNQESKGVGTI